MATPTTYKPTFWKEDVVYQIYPSSFKDTTGNGWGDLNGITSKLPYLKSLGVDIVWLSPIYASPMKDMGYDIADYRSINPSMGTLADWENMTATAHSLGLKLVMDLVVNHTSDQHAWFQESRKGGSKKDWYYWRKPKFVDGKRQEPNNWGAIFGGSAWEWDEGRQEYYLHVFDVSQPDLNWENEEVRNAVWDIMEFWLSKVSFPPHDPNKNRDVL
jgi:oligo-1,6-glucosidase